MLKKVNSPVLLKITEGENIIKNQSKLLTIYTSKSSHYNTENLQCEPFYKHISKL